jgi:hypothetical protein
MNLLRQIFLCGLAALIGFAQLSNSPALGGLAALQGGGNALTQIKQQQEQGLFGIAGQRGGSVFSHNNAPAPAPLHSFYFFHSFSFLLAGPILANLRQSLPGWRFPLGLEVSDIIFPFHSFW